MNIFSKSVLGYCLSSTPEQGESDIYMVKNITDLLSDFAQGGDVLFLEIDSKGEQRLMTSFVLCFA